MKKNLIGLLGLICSSSLWSGATPTYVQVPSAFVSESIATNTSRYFFKRLQFNYAGNEQYVFSLQNTGSRVARISAIGCETHSAVASNYFALHFYKNSNASDTNYTPINNSTLQISTQGYFTSGYNTILQGIGNWAGVQGDEVYALQAVGSFGGVRGFEYIPKELYSLIVASGETLTITLDANGSAMYDVIIMWEEIIN